MSQKVCIGTGIFFILVGLLGLVLPGLFKLHLSLAHNLIHLVSGALALWAGYADDFRRSYYFCLVFGVAYGLLGLWGFFFGATGYPDVGHLEIDDNLLRVIPNALEFGTADHTLHLLLSALFLVTAYVWKKNRQTGGRTLTDYRSKTDYAKRRRGTEASLRSEADLGRSDINRRSDLGRRSDFERRL